MKFKDLFLPKIVRSDPEIRKEAVRQEINVELLKQVIEKDSDPDVRQLAEERIRALRPEVAVENF
jgi:hypothetical protein